MRWDGGIVGDRTGADGRAGRLGLAALAAAAALAMGIGAVAPQVTPGRVAGGAARGGEVGPLHYLPASDAFPLVGSELRSGSGADLGRIAEVLVDGWGRPKAVVVEIGGFLGIGTREVAVDWRALRFDTARRRQVSLFDVSPQQLQRSPPYTAGGAPVAAVTAPGAATGADLQAGP